jgi:hypothetical protein
MPSTAVRDIAYDEETGTLEVTFVPTGRRYAYRKVPVEVFDAFRHAFSKGTFFNRHIRDGYECERVGS